MNATGWSSADTMLGMGGDGTPITESAPSSSGLGKLLTVSVVGWSGAEKEKGAVGVGKSCLCNRFVRPLEDEYRTDHISTLSQVDFGGRVINNDHWLYWGERTVFTDDGCELTVRVLEQTEFVDDESFQPLKASSASQREVYLKRCASTRLYSPDKLMYISKEQLGIEQEYEQRSLPEGKASVDGFLCVYDVGASARHHRQPGGNRQVEFVSQILQNILKTRKPVVMVTTKNDEADETLVREAQRLLQSRKEFRNGVPLVESSAHTNVNVEAAFGLLTVLIERQQRAASISSKMKVLSYSEAARNRREIVDVATAAYAQKLRSASRDDHRTSWNQISRQLAHDPDFIHFAELCGTNAAQRLFKQHLKDIREKCSQRRLHSQMERLPEIIPLLLSDLALLHGKTWQDILRELPRVVHWEEYVQPLGCTDGESAAQDDHRVPAELLYSPEAEAIFRCHLASLESESKRKRLQDEFAQLIASCPQVTPGKPLADVKIFFLGKECFESLSDNDLQMIYDRYQSELMQGARGDLVELLLEQVDEFVSRALLRKKSNRAISGKQRAAPIVGPPRTNAPALPGLSERDWRELHEKLQEDSRYRQLNRLHQSRDSLISQYLSFVCHPLRQHCPAYPRCMDGLVEQLLANNNSGRSLWKTTSSDHLSFPPLSQQRMNILVLGQDALAELVIRELRAFLRNDLFVHRGSAYKLDYRSVDCHDAWSQSMFQPNGLICAFSSRSSLDFVKHSVSRALLPSGDHSGTPSLRGLPVVLLFAFDPSNLDDLPYLQQQGGQLAERWQCVFIGLEPSESDAGQGTLAARGPSVSPSLFTVEQLNRALSFLLVTAVQRTSTDPASSRPDASLTVCLMCGDEYAPELVLGPLLVYQCNPPSSSSFSIEMFSPGCDRKLRYQVNVSSYHSAFVGVSEYQYTHGYILVYTARRRASLAHLHSLAHLVPDPIPILVVAVGEVTEFFSDPATNSLITEGNQIADRMGARFVTVSKAAEQQVSIYTPFLEEMWTKVGAVEAAGFAKRNGQWYGEGDNRPPPPPYTTLANTENGGRQSQVASSMTGSIYSNEGGGRMYIKGARLSESCLSVAAFTDHSSTPSPSTSKAKGRVVGRRRSSCRQIHSGPPCSFASSARRRRFGSTGDQPSSPVSSDRRHTASATDIHQLPGRHWIAGWKKAFRGWWDGGAEYGKVQRAGSAASSSSPRRTVENEPDRQRQQQTKPSRINLASMGGRTASSAAPLATPESIELGAEYMTVKDALAGVGWPSSQGTGEYGDDEQQYATVDSIFNDNTGHAESSGMVDKALMAFETTRAKPSGVGGVTIAERVRQLNAALTAGRDRQILVQRRSASEESLLDPFARGRTPWRAARHQSRPVDKKRMVMANGRCPADAAGAGGFVRKVTSSFRFRRKKSTDGLESHSTPQSPLLSPDNARVFVLPPYQTTLMWCSNADGDDEGDGQKVSSTRSPKKDRTGQSEKSKERKISKDAKKSVGEAPARVTGKKKSREAAQAQLMPADATLRDLAASRGDPVPLYVRKCVQFVEATGLQVEGLYRVPGNQAHVVLLEQKFIDDPNVSFDDLDLPVNAVATSLKNFFSSLSEPVVPYNLYDQLMQATSIRQSDDRQDRIRQVLQQLPPENRAVLRYFIGHLRKVADNFETTAMDHRNLAKCWWPTLLRPQFDSFETMAQMTQRLEEFVQLLLEHPELLS